jgi:rhomboid protease GluP
LANCRQCGAKLPSFSFGESSPYCKSCQSQFELHAAPEANHSVQAPGFAANPTAATYVLLGINIAIFLAMVLSGISWIDPDTQQVLRWGADYGPSTFRGQYWRLLSSMFLHFGIIHLLGNMWCLWSLGKLAEKILGSFNLIGIYLLTGIGASLLSLSWNPMRVSAGASGAIFGIAGVLISVLYYGKLNLDPQRVRSLLGYVVRFALINILFGLQGHIDNMAHVGGLVTGLLSGVFLARTFSSAPEERTLRQRKILFTSAIVLLLLFIPVARAKQYAVDFSRGLEAFDRKDYAAAIESLQRYTSARPDDDYAHAILGASFQTTGHVDEAVREYERGLAINPDYHYIQVNLATLYVYQKKPEKAVPLFTLGIPHTDPDAETMYFYGSALKQTGKLAKAEAALRKSIELDNKLIEAHELLSEVLKAEGKIAEATAEQRLADMLEPSESAESGAAHKK